MLNAQNHKSINVFEFATMISNRLRACEYVAHTNSEEIELQVGGLSICE